jgi:hypothetical protein
LQDTGTQIRNGKGNRKAMSENVVFNPLTGVFIFLPKIVFFRVDRDILTDERPVIVSWETLNTTAVKINGETVELNGSKGFHSMKPIILELVAENEMRIAVREIIQIGIDKQPPWIASFNIHPVFAVQGTPITLSWKIIKAKRIAIDNGVGDVSGTESITVTTGSNGIYHLTAYNYFGYKSTAVASLAVYPVPLVKGIFIPQPLLELQKIDIPTTSFAGLAKFKYNLKLNFDQCVFAEPLKLETITPLWRQHPGDVSLKNTFTSLPGVHKEIIHMIKFIWKKKIREWIRKILARD